MATKPTKISRVKAGDPLSSKHYNQLVDSINLIMDAISGVEGLSTTLRLIELDEDMTQFGRDKTGNRMLYDIDVSAGSDPITDFGIDETYVSEVQNGIHLAGERLPLMFDRSSGKQLILPVMNWHLAKLTSALPPGGTATATIWQVASDAEASAITGVTVYDWMLGESRASLLVGAASDADITDGSELAITDASGTAVTFEFDKNSSVGAGNTAIAITAGMTNSEIVGAIADAINAEAGFVATAVVDGATVILTDIGNTVPTCDDANVDVADQAPALPSGSRVFVFLHRQSQRWYVIGIAQLKSHGRALFGAQLTTSEATIAGTLVNQWGCGYDHDDTSITLHNFETSSAGIYEFYGANGSACLCSYMGYGDHWQIVQPECPPAAS